jgi:hypothetical protein
MVCQITSSHPMERKRLSKETSCTSSAKVGNNHVEISGTILTHHF